ncbi:MAG: hypothetical protein WAK80_00805, partial [Candidatus Cybelea sp.]
WWRVCLWDGLLAETIKPPTPRLIGGRNAIDIAPGAPTLDAQHGQIPLAQLGLTGSRYGQQARLALNR